MRKLWQTGCSATCATSSSESSMTEEHKLFSGHHSIELAEGDLFGGGGGVTTLVRGGERGNVWVLQTRLGVSRFCRRRSARQSFTACPQSSTRVEMVFTTSVLAARCPRWCLTKEKRRRTTPSAPPRPTWRRNVMPTEMSLRTRLREWYGCSSSTSTKSLIMTPTVGVLLAIAFKNANFNLSR
jgi:hypothetical protein